MDPSPLAGLFKNSNYDKPIASDENAIAISSLKENMKLSALLYLYEVFLENRESENCYEVLKVEFYKVIDESSLNDKHECNDISMNSMNINCANDMQSYKLGDDEFDEHDIFSPPTNEEVIKEKYDWDKHDNLYDSSDDDTLDENNAFYCHTMSVGTVDDDFVMPTTYCDDHDWGDNYDASCILKIYLSLMMNLLLIIIFATLLKVGLEECQLYVKRIPHVWRIFNLMKFLIKVGVERSWL